MKAENDEKDFGKGQQASGNEKHEELKSEEMDQQVENNDGKDSGEERKEGSQKEYDQLYDKYIRLYSDFDNFRRRTAKERLELIQQANADLMKGLLTVMDDLERALKSNPDSDDSFSKGVELIYNKLKKTLEQKGLQPIEAIGTEFDPETHDAITKIPAPEPGMKGKVVDQIEKGYILNDKIIRHAKVVVGE